MDHQAQIKEINRQTQFFTDALNIAIRQAAKDVGGQPTMNAIAAAVVSVQAALICAVPAGHPRKQLRKIMEKTLPRAIAAYEGKVGTSQVINLDMLQ